MKYRLIKTDSIKIGERTLFRIQRIFDDAFGGYIENEANLSHNGKAWVYEDAQVCGNAKVYGDAQVCGNAKVYGDAQVFGDALVYGNALVCGNAKVCGDALVCGNAKVYGDAYVYGSAAIALNSKVQHTDQYITLQMNPHSITITSTAIVIGCQVRSRFGKNQWKKTDEHVTPELYKRYKPVINFLKKMLPRKRS